MFFPHSVSIYLWQLVLLPIYIVFPFFLLKKKKEHSNNQIRIYFIQAFASYGKQIPYFSVTAA